MKRQIHAVRGHQQVVVPGHDVKLGCGGICEIEFFVQTQQFIFWRRSSQMRGSRIEHRLQMIADEQTSASRSSARRSRASPGSAVMQSSRDSPPTSHQSFEDALNRARDFAAEETFHIGLNLLSGLYDFPAAASESEGRKRLGLSLYYVRLTQRLISALTAPTKAGCLDMRLGPSERQGPLAIQFASFKLYEQDEAETVGSRFDGVCVTFRA
jgi:glutamine synthetase adenylyltransferase